MALLRSGHAVAMGVLGVAARAAAVKIKYTDREGRAHELDGEEGQTLKELLDMHSIANGTCGGQKVCGNCHVYADAGVAGRLPAVGEDEDELLATVPGRQGGSRLACAVTLSPALHGGAFRAAPPKRPPAPKKR